MVGFVHDLCNKSILIVTSVTNSIELFNGYVSAHMDYSTLFQVGVNSLLSTTQDHDFDIAVYESAKHYSGKQYINDRYQSILMYFENTMIVIELMYVPIWEPS